MGFLSLLSGKAWAGLGAACAFAIFIGLGAMALVDSTLDACEGKHALAAQQATAAAHKDYLAALEWGNQISADLAKTQRRLDATKTEYLAYANAITGNCPDPLRVLAHYAARNEPVPETSGAPTDPGSPVSAAALGANIAENFTRCHSNAAQLNALIRWIDGHEGAVKQ